MDKKPIKFYGPKSIILGYPLFVLAIFGIWSFFLVVFLQGGNKVTSPQEAKIVFIIESIAAVLLLIFCIVAFRYVYSAITISEQGICKALLKKYFKCEIKWNELYELKIIMTNVPILFASKISMEGLKLDNSKDVRTIKCMTKRKDVIELLFSKKTLCAIRQYCNMPIIGLSDEENDI